MKPEIDKLIPEISFKTSRSSGSGGQNVNKIESKVSLIFNIETSLALDDNQKNILFQKLDNIINSENELIVNCEESRSQLKNKKQAIDKFKVLIDKAFEEKKKRKKTKPTKAAKMKRLEEKKKMSQKKENRNFKL